MCNRESIHQQAILLYGLPMQVPLVNTTPRWMRHMSNLDNSRSKCNIFPCSFNCWVPVPRITEARPNLFLSRSSSPDLQHPSFHPSPFLAIAGFRFLGRCGLSLISPSGRPPYYFSAFGLLAHVCDSCSAPGPHLPNFEVTRGHHGCIPGFLMWISIFW